ncbi:MAG: phosphocholine cytidylyltransferase family protein [Patescibacteria group bacterium]|jgi:choline kinase
MKAVILAAGMGTRFGTLIPKPLTSLKNEKTILDSQITKLSKVEGLDNIFIVVGYKKEIIMEAHPEGIFVYNDAYAHTNTAKSLLTALEKINDDVIWLNGDVYFDSAILDLLVNSDTSACLVDTKKCGDEEIKYKQTDQGFIKELSKEVKEGVGEAVGINLIKQKDLDNFVSELRNVGQKDYFEKALENLTLSGKLNLRAINIGNYYCKEIDFEQDLLEVQNYINTLDTKNGEI